MLTIAYLNNILLHAEFSAMDYTLNIVSKCRFFFIFIFAGSEKVLENFSWGPGKVLDFFVSKRVGTLCLSVYLSVCLTVCVYVGVDHNSNSCGWMDGFVSNVLGW